LESAVAGTPLYVIDDNTDESRIKEIEEKVVAVGCRNFAAE
jgi:hypothetical protein